MADIKRSWIISHPPTDNRSAMRAVRLARRPRVPQCGIGEVEVVSLEDYVTLAAKVEAIERQLAGVVKENERLRHLLSRASGDTSEP